MLVARTAQYSLVDDPQLAEQMLDYKVQQKRLIAEGKERHRHGAVAHERAQAEAGARTETGCQEEQDGCRCRTKAELKFDQEPELKTEQKSKRTMEVDVMRTKPDPMYVDFGGDHEDVEMSQAGYSGQALMQVTMAVTAIKQQSSLEFAPQHVDKLEARCRMENQPQKDIGYNMLKHNTPPLGLCLTIEVHSTGAEARLPCGVFGDCLGDKVSSFRCFVWPTERHLKSDHFTGDTVNRNLVPWVTPRRGGFCHPGPLVANTH